jgi:hypothetical protein
MTQINYNRPNGGYEQEPWRKQYPQVSLPKLDPLPIRQHKNLGHEVKLINKKSGPHSGFYKCVSCDKWLAWASK